MARTQTLTEMIAAVVESGQYEGSQDITTALVTDYINRALPEVWDLLIEKWDDYYLTQGTLPLVANTASYALPATFYKLRALTLQVGNRQQRIYPHDLSDQWKFNNNPSINPWKQFRYRIQGSNIVFVPTPTTSYTVNIFYIPCAPVLVNPSDTFDGINGYEELVTQLAYKRCKEREDLDTGQIDNEIARLTARIRTAADGRDSDMPMTFAAPRGRRGHRGGDDGGWF